MGLKEILRQIIPPILWKALVFVWRKLKGIKNQLVKKCCKEKGQKNGQDLDLYWDSKMAVILDTWGDGNAWVEVKYIMLNCKGKVLDIACGTGKTIEILSIFPGLELYGCDISDFLLEKAVNRGIPKERLKVCDATKTGYQDNAFDYSYSIGSLEHFTLEGIAQFITESHRITKYGSYHMIPVSRSGKDEGWMKTHQSFHNNSVPWWEAQFKRVYQHVYVFESSWQDDISLGKWIICLKEVK